MDIKVDEVDDHKIRLRIAAWKLFNIIAYCVFTVMVWTSEPSPYENFENGLITLGKALTVILPPLCVLIYAWMRFRMNSK